MRHAPDADREDAPVPESSRATRWILLAFGIATLSAVALAVVYAAGGQPQAEGGLLGAALLGIGTGLVVWAHRLLPSGPFVEDRPPLADDPQELAALDRDLEPETDLTAPSRRRVLVGGLAAALGALAVALAFPVRSLGPRPGRSLETTPWRPGRRAVNEAGEPILARDVAVGSLVTVFPQGHVGSADGQAVLVRVRESELDLPPGRKGWTPGGLVAYSKVCTHAGCPVGLYEPVDQTLLCPCHQSAFDVLTGAQPRFGPAARALPQLPLAIDDDGYVVAQSDFHEPIGPAFWNRP